MHDKHIAKWDFEAFKSNVCHQVKTLGALDFILNTLQNDSIRCYWDNLCYREAFYLLAMLYYLSRINDIPMCTRYDDIRDYSLQKPVYPKDVRLAAKLLPEYDAEKRCRDEAIPEFLRFNIMECNIRNIY